MSSLAQNAVSKVQTTIAVVSSGEGDEVSLFTMSDKKITDLIYATHVHADDNFDEDSLFLIVQNILSRATQSIEKLVQGSQVHVENVEEGTHAKANFNVPLCTLKSINSEICCNAPGEETAHKTTLAILNKLSNYSWEAKAVLALAALALEFGDFWLLAQLYQSDPLAKQLAILKRVPTLINPSELPKRRQAILEVSNLIKTTMRVIAMFNEFEKLSVYDHKDIPCLTTVFDHLPVDVYWSILTITACATKVSILISEEPDRPHDLAPYAQKIHYILNQLVMQLTICRRQLEEAEAYRKIKKVMRTPTGIVEIFKALIFSNDNVVLPLIDGSTNKTVTLEVLKGRTVYMLFSSLDITDDDITLLKPIHDDIISKKKETNYAIVWIPIVEQWTEELKNKYETLRKKMSWHSLQLFTPIAGIKFVKEEWRFQGKPILVVINPQGKVENLNAFHLIRVWGLKAFPFNKQVEEKIDREHHWIGSVVNNIHPTIETWVKEEKYIFFYGGNDNELIQTFTKKVTALVNDPFIKEAKVKIELFCVGKNAEGGEDHGILRRFWTGIESLFFSKAHKDVADPVRLEIQKLLSYKNESAWAVLSKGSSVVTTGHGSALLKVVEEFDSWKAAIKVKGFEVAFKEYYAKVTETVRHCSRLDVPTVAGKAPDTMKCPECPRVMETYASYKCCHVDGPHH
ncbi:protein SIEVE ELEMENT OCCLUSION B-like [Humulus lupulus]|uniref:protein SIEVE ELEMENT OCCLUSION B-like n=1 Tax=Humulus lupulus TaxID=3486 RepID=UPI002B4015DA|nr:protein SIEVE ELEMENT OCCLUSION B-like [Humulus lupulus]